MSISFLFLLLLIVTAALSSALEGPFLHGLVGMIAGGALGVVAYTVPGRTSELMCLRRPLALIILMGGLPAAWMLLQILPLGVLGLAGPIWQSTQSALGRPVPGTISVDHGATIVALGRYLAAGAILLVAAFETVARRQAAWTLFALVGASTLFAIDVLLEQIAGLSFLRGLDDRPTATAAGASASLGTTLAAIAAVRLVNSHGRRSTQPGAGRQLALGLVPSLIAFALCGAAVLSRNMWQDALASICGLVIFAFVLAGRRFHLVPWHCIGSAAVVVIFLVALAASRNDLMASDPLLALGSAPPAQAAIAARMIRDGAWFGSGAGTYDAILPVYGVAAESVGAPTAAAAIEIELGPPALGIVALMVIALVAWLMRAALLRGRDSSYPTAAAAALVVLSVQSFANASLFATSIQILASVLVGLGLAQSESRSNSVEMT